MIYHKHAWLLATLLAYAVNIDAVFGHQEELLREHEGNVVGSQAVFKKKTSDLLDANGSNLHGHDGEDETNVSYIYESNIIMVVMRYKITIC